MAFIRTRGRALALALVAALLFAQHAPLARQQQKRACTVRVTLLQVNDVYRFTPDNCASSLRLPALTRSKKATACGLPFTCNSNCSGRRPSTKRPCLSKTATSVCTSSDVMRTTSSSCSAADGLCRA